VQYHGITIGIVILFILLVMLGTFKVSTPFVLLASLLSFLMLFEFIFFIPKKNFTPLPTVANHMERPFGV